MVLQTQNTDEESTKAVVTSDEQTITIQTAQAEPLQATSIQPSINEIERFIQFLLNKNNISIPSNKLVVLIQKTEPQTKGYYSPKSWTIAKHDNPQDNEPSPSDSINGLVFKHQTADICEITLSSINLTFEPYETIAHELAHFLNTHLDKYEGNGRNYHTRDFKSRAEQLGLRVEKGNYGFNQTYETDEFKQTIAEFKPNPTAFKIFQPTDYRIVGIDGNGNPIDVNGNIVKRQPKGNSRLILYKCSCGVKIRTARNESKPLKAICQYCNTEFKADIKPTPTPTAEPKQEPTKQEPQAQEVKK